MPTTSCLACDGVCCSTQEYTIKKRTRVKHDSDKEKKHVCPSCDDGTTVVPDIPAPPNAPVKPAPTNAQQVFSRITKLYFDTYPAYRPTYAECQVLMAMVHSVSVRGSIGPGHVKTMDMLEKKLHQKGILVQP